MNPEIREKLAKSKCANAIVIRTRVKAGRWGNGD